MNKKVLISAVVAFVVAGAAGGVYMVMQNSAKKTVTPVTEQPQPTQAKKLLSDTMKEYQDPAGFSFSYPDNLIVTANVADKNAYSQLNITSPDATGSIGIKVTDSTYKTLADWSKKNKATDSATITDTKFAELDAKELEASDASTLVAIDKGGVLFTIVKEPNGKDDLWKEVYDKVKSTFAFKLPEQASSSSSSGSNDSGVVTEPEEVVE